MLIFLRTNVIFCTKKQACRCMVQFLRGLLPMRSFLQSPPLPHGSRRLWRRERRKTQTKVVICLCIHAVVLDPGVDVSSVRRVFHCRILYGRYRSFVRSSLFRSRLKTSFSANPSYHSLTFYRAMLCIRGTSHEPVSVRVCVCLCLSVASRSSTKTAKRRIT